MISDDPPGDRANAGDSALTAQSRATVDDAITKLRREYGSFPIVADTWAVEESEYRQVCDRFRDGSIGGAGAWVTNDAGAVLLVKDVDDDGWSEPAGKHEPEETLSETAVREVKEETGIDCRLTGVEIVQRIQITNTPKPPLDRLIVTFAADYVRGIPRPAPGETDDVRWWRTRPDSLSYDLLERLPFPSE